MKTITVARTKISPSIGGEYLFIGTYFFDFRETERLNEYLKGFIKERRSKMGKKKAVKKVAKKKAAKK